MEQEFDRWRSMKDLCMYLGISRDTAMVWIKEKNMPSHRIGRPWKFKFSEVDAWIKADGAAESVGCDT